MAVFETILSEQDILEAWGLTKEQLRQLREEGLPFLKVNKNVKLYHADDLNDFLLGRRMIHEVQHREK